MNSLLILFIMTFSFAPHVGFAKSSTLLIGGGCQESLGEKMRAESDQYLKTMTRLGWSTSSAYGKSATDLDHPGSRPLTRSDFIDELKKSALGLKPGDQFLLNIVTHGLYREKGHQICLGDGSMLDLNDPEIHAHLGVMKEKGVKIGIMDNSCYGGQTVQLFSQYGCVVTSQVASFPSISLSKENGELLRFGVGSMARKLLDQSGERPVTLEDAFVESCLHYDVCGVFPMMSGLNSLNAAGEKFAYTIWSELGGMKHYQNQSRICSEPGLKDLKKSIDALMLPVSEGISSEVSARLGYGSRDQRRKAIKDSIKKIKKLNEDTKNKEEALSKLKKKESEAFREYRSDVFLKRPLLIDPTSLSEPMKQVLSAQNCKSNGPVFECKFDWNTISDALSAQGTSETPFSITAYANPIPGRTEMVKEFEAEVLKPLIDARIQETKNHPSYRTLLELRRPREALRAELNDLKKDQLNLMETLTRDLNVNRALEHLSGKSASDPEQVQSCRSFVLNPK